MPNEYFTKWFYLNLIDEWALGFIIARSKGSFVIGRIEFGIWEVRSIFDPNNLRGELNG